MMGSPHLINTFAAASVGVLTILSHYLETETKKKKERRGRYRAPIGVPNGLRWEFLLAEFNEEYCLEFFR